MKWRRTQRDPDDTEMLRRQAPVAYFLLISSVVLLVIAAILGQSIFDRPLLFAIIAFSLGMIFAIGILVVSIASCISEEILYLAAETRQEAGSSAGDLSEAVRNFADLFDFYERTLKHRFMSPLVVRLFGVNRAFQKARMTISDPVMGASLQSIHRVGEDLARFCEFRHERRYGRFYSHAKRFIDADPEYAREAVRAMDDFHVATRQLAESPSFLAAHAACVTSRLAGAKLHCSWPEYWQIYKADQTRVLQFREDLEKARTEMERVITTASATEAQLLSKYRVSLERRRETLDALRFEDRLSVWKILHSAVATTVPSTQ